MANDSDVFEENVPNSKNSQSDDSIELPSSQLLTLEELDALQKKNSVKIISLIGEGDCGKTTLALSIYNEFLKRAFAGYKFFNSNSLLGFEKMSYLSRAISGLEIPETMRTSFTSNLEFFHLALKKSNLTKPINLAISEWAGEHYNAIPSTPNSVSDFLEIANADELVFIVNGEKIMDNLEREATFTRCKKVIRAVYDSKCYKKNVNFSLLTTKIDQVTSRDLKNRLTVFEEQICRDFEVWGSECRSFRTSVRNTENKTIGLSKLLQSWVS